MPLSRLEIAYYAMCLGGGAWLYHFALGQVTWSPTDALVALAFGLVAFLSFFGRVRLDSEGYDYTLDDVPLYALVFLQGWASAVVVMAAASFVYEVQRLVRALREHRDRVRPLNVFLSFTNPFMMALWCAAAGLAYQVLDAGDPLLGSVRNLAAILATSVLLSALAMGTNSVTILLRRRDPLSQALDVFRRNYGQIWLHVLMLAPLGALLALFVKHQPPAAVLLVVPVIMMHNSFETQRKLLREAESTVKAMATYLDERDHYTQGHSERVAGYARAIARRLGLSPADVDRVHRAGLIHDIGKIDVPDAILRKPGALSEGERAVMRTHVVRATDLGSKLVALRRDIPFDVAAYHHERYDGMHSMFGLKGEDIPLESRILAVADMYDAMTSDRPYRQGMPTEEALGRLRSARGSQLDPRAVDAFLEAAAAGDIADVAREWDRREAERGEATASP